jgi:TRAP-type C4-dicarboxylate transport system permease small subunit
MEDERSLSPLLTWASEPPLSSRPAKVSYFIGLIFVVLAGFLIYGQFQQPQSAGRDFNILSLGIAIGLPALSVPLPFVLEHFKSRETGRWSFSQTAGN